ncbi:MMPL family transporter [Lacipirellula limnantheis]|uniref:MMPL family protein n=1 Tax=Lacipirellula limnantheis TaxID=2528024 RepID=A0A517TU87_9BACT|nr:MMPL family transporter [Lacipirellula limnantheis]QDT71927.1 MMPL family protein [Lacipirellula limnantheis]
MRKGSFETTPRDCLSMPTKQPSFLARTTLGLPHYLLVAMAALFVLALAPLGAWKAVQRQSNQIESWLPASHGVALDDRWFREQFDGQQFIMVSWDDCTLGKPAKLATLARKLQQEAAGPDSAIARVETGPQWVDRLTAAPYGLAYEGAIDRLEGTFVGPPQRDERGASLGYASRQTCLVAYVTPLAASSDAAVASAIERIRTAAQESGIEVASLRMAGPAIDAVLTGQENLASLLRWGSLAVLLSAAICAWRLHSIRLAAMVALPAVASGVIMLAIVFYSGALEVLSLGRPTPLLGVADALVMAAPLLTYALALVAGLRVLHYYRDARLAHGLDGAAERAVADGWPGLGMVALLFAALMGALCFSDLLPLRRFGLFAGLGTLASVGAVLAILPVWLHRFPLGDRAVKSMAGPRQDGSPSPRLASVFEAAITGRGLMAAAGLLVLAAAVIGAQQLNPVTRLPALLGGRSALVSDYDWFGARVGHAVPLEIVLTVPNERHRDPHESPEVDGQQYRMTKREQMEFVSEVQARLDGISELSGSLSAGTLLPASGDLGDGVALQRDLTALELVRAERRMGSDLETGRQLWRVSARLMAATPGLPVDYLATRDRVHIAVNPVLQAYEQRDWLVRELHERGGQLQDAAICILFHGLDDAATPEDGAPAALLGALLNRSGVQRGGVTYYNTRQLERQGQAAAARERAADSLRNSAVVLAAPVADASPEATALAGLAQAGLSVIDLGKLPPIEESATSPSVEIGGARPIRAVFNGTPMIATAVSEELSATPGIVWKVVVPGLIVAMMCVVWHPVVGLAAVIAVALPLALTLGVMGWAGLPYDLGIVLIGGLAVGLALDGAIHYVAWFRHGVNAELFRDEAARMAFARCAPATVDGAIAIGIGFSALALSPVTLFHQLGLVALGLEAAVLFACLVVLPAIMASPLAAMMGADAAPAAANQTIPPVRIVLPGEGDGELRPSRTDAAATGVPAPTHRGRTPVPASHGGRDAEGPHESLQAKLQRLRHASGE